MNAARRKRLAEIISDLETAHEALTALAEEERDAFASLPDSLQNGEKGQRMEEIADSLESAASDVETAKSYAEEAEAP